MALSGEARRRLNVAIGNNATAKEIADAVDTTTGGAFSSNVAISDTFTFTVGSTSQLAISNGDGSTAMTPTTQVLGTAKADGSLLLAVNSATATTAAAPSVNFLKSAHAALGSNTVVASGEVLGEVNFFGADGTDFRSCAVSLRGIVDTTPGTGDMPGRFSIFCSADAAEALLEKVRVTGAATSAILQAGIAGTSTGELVLAGATSGTVTLRATAAAGGVAFILPAAVGSSGQQLATDGATPAVTSWAAAGSLPGVKRDVRELGDKEADEALARVLAAQVYSFRYDPRAKDTGFTTNDFATVYTGVMANEYPGVMHHDGKIFNPGSAFGELVLALQALAREVETLKPKGKKSH